MDGVELVFEPEALEMIADRAIERKIGARGLRSIVEEVMTDIMYSVPSDPSVRKIIISVSPEDGTVYPLILHLNDMAG